MGSMDGGHSRLAVNSTFISVKTPFQGSLSCSKSMFGWDSQEYRDMPFLSDLISWG
jgi:hypothetical protein